MDELVSNVDHDRFDPVALRTEFPQLSVTLTEGAAGIGIGLELITAGALVHPETV